jgi:hypothetical protein
MLEKGTMWKKNKFKETPAVLELFYKMGIQGFSQFIDDIQAAHHIHMISHYSLQFQWATFN